MMLNMRTGFSESEMHFSLCTSRSKMPSARVGMLTYCEHCSDFR
jgi:hypothetical protein